MSKKKNPLMPEKDLAEYTRIANAYNLQIDEVDNPDDFDRIPCIIYMSDGSVQLVDCKTLKPIKK